MNIAALLADLRNLDIHVWAEGDLLRCNAPAGALTPALRERLRVEKSQIIQYLQSAALPRPIVPIQPLGNAIPIFAVGGHNGDVSCFRALARHMGRQQPFFGLQPPGLDDDADPLTSVEDLARTFAAAIKSVRPNGPVVLAGYCAGGAVAFETARQMVEGGYQVECVALLAGRHPAWFRPFGQARHQVVLYLERLGVHGHALASLPHKERARYVAQMLERLRTRRIGPGSIENDPVLQTRARVQQATFRAVCRYEPPLAPLRLCLFLPSAAARRSADGLLQWRTLTPNVEVYCGPAGCEGDAMLLEPNVRTVAEQFQRCIAGMEASLEGVTTVETGRVFETPSVSVSARPAAELVPSHSPR